VNGALTPGSVSIRLYASAPDAAGILADLLEQARQAEAAGFDGVTVSEHHGGFPGYLPNPLQMSAWVLEECPRVWAGPGPLLLPLRPAALVAEEVAWLAVRFPGRVMLGVAPGSLEQDFAIAGSVLDDTLAGRFDAGLEMVASALAGRAAPPLAADQALSALAPGAVPVISAAMSRAAVRRAARRGVGLLTDGLSRLERVRQLVDWYREEGGDGPGVLTRWVWCGQQDPARIEAEAARYASYTPDRRRARFADDNGTISGPADQVASGLLQAVAETGATVLNLRVHAMGVTGPEVLDQIATIGAGVLPAVRAGWLGTVSRPASDPATTPPAARREA
jgi:alkanesulfonate monooxygenase SsuD/methylene tetrahydromethanopterin reductase-like flavin-dependent oxidoreductase (luciferase family)